MSGDGNNTDKPSVAAAMGSMQAALGGTTVAAQTTAQAAAVKPTIGADLKRIIKEVSQEARKSRVPLYIAVLAACLALVSMAEGDAKERALGAQIEASNQFAYFQAKNIRKTDSQIAADMLESMGKTELAKAWRDKANRYDSEKGAILKEARAQQAIRAHGLKQSSYFAICHCALADRHCVGDSILDPRRWYAAMGQRVHCVAVHVLHLQWLLPLPRVSDRPGGVWQMADH